MLRGCATNICTHSWAARFCEGFVSRTSSGMRCECSAKILHAIMGRAVVRVRFTHLLQCSILFTSPVVFTQCRPSLSWRFLSASHASLLENGPFSSSSPPSLPVFRIRRIRFSGPSAAVWCVAGLGSYGAFFCVFLLGPRSLFPGRGMSLGFLGLGKEAFQDQESTSRAREMAVSRPPGSRLQH